MKRDPDTVYMGMSGVPYAKVSIVSHPTGDVLKIQTDNATLLFTDTGAKQLEKIIRRKRKGMKPTRRWLGIVYG